MKRRTTNIFSLSFIDCICCGLGAIILLFVIVNARSADYRSKVTQDLRSQADRLEQEVLEGHKNLVQLRNALEKTEQEIVSTQGLSREVIKTLRQRKLELADYDDDTLASREHINRLKADLKSAEEEVRRLKAGSRSAEDMGRSLRPFPGQGDRQYLTDLKMGGQHILILVDASASMLDDTIVGIIRRRNMADSEKLKSAKWQQAVATVDWLTTQLPRTSKFQVFTFNETAEPLLSGTQGGWLDAGNVTHLNEVVSRLRRVVPRNGTSLLNAFEAMRKLTPQPDNVFLLTDGLPTMGADKPWGKKVSGNKRLKLFSEAVARLPSRIPINVVLYPMEGDPMAASAFWRLAVDTRGSFFCPAADWP
jgi:hypothetical protein